MEKIKGIDLSISKEGVYKLNISTTEKRVITITCIPTSIDYDTFTTYSYAIVSSEGTKRNVSKWDVLEDDIENQALVVIKSFFEYNTGIDKLQNEEENEDE
jgi:hypothetical protein